MKTSDLGDRSTYLGATDIAGVVGVSPFAAPIDVYREKVEGIHQEQNAAMGWGNLLEQAICDGYEAETGRRLIRRNAATHPQYPFIIGHPDRIVVGEPGVVDAKATQFGAGYGEPGTDQVPPHVRVQMTIYLGLLRREWCDVAVLKGTRGLAIYRVTYDAELYDALITAAVDFWEEHILRRVPPPVDGTEAYRRYLAERFPKDDGLEMVATSEQALMVEALRNTSERVKELEAHKTLIENSLRSAMGEATALVAPAGRVTWKTQGPRVGWQDVAVKVAADAGLDVAQYAAQDIESKPGTRVFRFAPSRAEEAAAA